MLFLFWLSLSCKPAVQPPKPVPQVRYRPVLEEDIQDHEQQLLEYLHKGTIDKGLVKAAEELLGALRDPTARVTASSVLLATSRAGFPGQARFAKVLNGGAFPEDMVKQVRKQHLGEELDLALVYRNYGNGMMLWLLGWAPHVLDLDPIPLELELDGSVSVRISADSEVNASLLITPPDEAVRALPILPEAHRSLREFHTPGPYRFEVISKTPGDDIQKVALLFTLFVDQDPPPPERLFAKKIVAANPREAELFLYKEVNKLRVSRGLHPLKVFSLFESVAREHSAWMASTGTLSHVIPGVTQGVPHHASNLAHPRARHYENIAVAFSALEALELAKDSPGHLQTFLCTECTHMSIGAALEPVRQGNPRLYVTWELLYFPHGTPKKIQRLK